MHEQIAITLHLHDQKKQCQHHIDIEAFPFLASYIQIPDSVMNSYYTMENATQLLAKGSHCGLFGIGLSEAKNTEHLKYKDS